MADAPDLGSGGLSRKSSSLFVRTREVKEATLAVKPASGVDRPQSPGVVRVLVFVTKYQVHHVPD